MRESVLSGRVTAQYERNIAATADAAKPPFPSTPSRDSCSRQVSGSLEEVDQESKRATPGDAAWCRLASPRPLQTGWNPNLPPSRPDHPTSYDLLRFFSGYLTCVNRNSLRTAGQRRGMRCIPLRAPQAPEDPPRVVTNSHRHVR